MLDCTSIPTYQKCDIVFGYWSRLVIVLLSLDTEVDLRYCQRGKNNENHKTLC